MGSAYIVLKFMPYMVLAWFLNSIRQGYHSLEFKKKNLNLKEKRVNNATALKNA